jgi:hypothetical protein
MDNTVAQQAFQLNGASDSIRNLAFKRIYILQVNGKHHDCNSFTSTTIKKSKAVPLQAWSGPEGSRKLRFPDFIITAQDGGKVVSLTHRPPLPPGNTSGTHFC